MKTKIKCKTSLSERINQIRVRIIKAPVVNNDDLRNVVYSRAHAIVL